MKKRYGFLLAGLLSAGLVGCDDEVKDEPTLDATDDTTPDTTPDSDNDATPDSTPDSEDDATTFPIDNLGPLTDGRVPGMTAPASVRYDQDGVPNVTAATDEDGVAVLGYLHARDRFAQMDIRRRLVRGRLSELVSLGSLVLPIDVENRTLFSTRDGRAIEDVLVETASPKTMALLTAYSAGVNAWIDDLVAGRNGASLPEEYSLDLLNIEEIAPWTPEDSMATVAALVESLTNDFQADVNMGINLDATLAAAGMDQQVFDEYFAPRPYTDATIIDDYVPPGPPIAFPAALRPAAAPTGPAYTAAQAALLRAAATSEEARRGFTDFVEDRGSNNWVMSGDITDSGDAILTNDPHLGLANPALWYVAHVDAKSEGTGTMDVAGMTFAGLPWVIIGQNEDIAWGATNTYFDLSDAFVEELNEDNSAVLFEGGEVPITDVVWDFPQADGTTAQATARYVPHHGPILQIDEEANTALSIRWTGNDMTTDVNFLTELMTATTVEEGRTAARNVTSIGQNWVMIDTAGSIGWFPYNNVPVRQGEQSGFLPRDGTGGDEWVTYYSYDDLPQAFNPATGYVATANNDMTGAFNDGDPTNDGHPLHQSGVALGFRQERIHDLIQASDAHTQASSLAIVGDVHSLLGEVAQDALVDVQSGDLSASAQSLYSAIQNWGYTCPTGLETSDQDSAANPAESAEALGCAAFHRVYNNVYTEWISDEFNEDGGFAGRPHETAFLYALTNDNTGLTDPDRFWDDIGTTEVVETREDIIVRAYEDAVTWFERAIGDDASDWLWGRIHATVFVADLFGSLGLNLYDSGPYAKDGGAYTVNVANPARHSGHMNNASGASMRLVCEAPASGVECTFQLPGGQPHFRQEDNYLGLVERWLDNVPTPLIAAEGDLGAAIPFDAPE